MRYLDLLDEDSHLLGKEGPKGSLIGCRYALWWSLIRGCEKVERMAVERRADVKEALLDWFGVGVKAQEISSFVKRMELLAQRVCSPTPPCTWASVNLGHIHSGPSC